MPKTLNKPYHHGNLKNELIDAALDILKKKGLVGLSLRELAINLGVSHGAPYRHFKNKTELLEAIAVIGHQNLIQVGNKARQKNPADPKQQLFELGLNYIQYVSRNPEIANLMFGGVLSLENCGPELKQASNDSIGGLFAIIESGKQSGLFVNKDTQSLALTALATVHGLSMLIIGGILKDQVSSDAKLQALGKSVYEIMLNGLLIKR
jgi:AcrR family transcriptional regulator